jgi:hypothetical protein
MLFKDLSDPAEQLVKFRGVTPSTLEESKIYFMAEENLYKSMMALQRANLHFVRGVLPFKLNPTTLVQVLLPVSCQSTTRIQRLSLRLLRR